MKPQPRLEIFRRNNISLEILRQRKNVFKDREEFFRLNPVPIIKMSSRHHLKNRKINRMPLTQTSNIFAIQFNTICLFPLKVNALIIFCHQSISSHSAFKHDPNTSHQNFPISKRQIIQRFAFLNRNKPFSALVHRMRAKMSHQLNDLEWFCFVNFWLHENTKSFKAAKNNYRD